MIGAACFLPAKKSFTSVPGCTRHRRGLFEGLDTGTQLLLCQLLLRALTQIVVTPYIYPAVIQTLILPLLLLHCWWRRCWCCYLLLLLLLDASNSHKHNRTNQHNMHSGGEYSNRELCYLPRVQYYCAAAAAATAVSAAPPAIAVCGCNSLLLLLLQV